MPRTTNTPSAQMDAHIAGDADRHLRQATTAAAAQANDQMVRGSSSGRSKRSSAGTAAAYEQKRSSQRHHVAVGAGPLTRTNSGILQGGHDRQGLCELAHVSRAVFAASRHRPLSCPRTTDSDHSPRSERGN